MYCIVELSIIFKMDINITIKYYQCNNPFMTGSARSCLLAANIVRQFYVNQQSR